MELNHKLTRDNGIALSIIAVISSVSNFIKYYYFEDLGFAASIFSIGALVLFVVGIAFLTTALIKKRLMSYLQIIILYIGCILFLIVNVEEDMAHVLFYTYPTILVLKYKIIEIKYYKKYCLISMLIVLAFSVSRSLWLCNVFEILPGFIATIVLFRIIFILINNELETSKNRNRVLTQEIENIKEGIKIQLNKMIGLQAVEDYKTNKKNIDGNIIKIFEDLDELSKG